MNSRPTIVTPNTQIQERGISSTITPQELNAICRINFENPFTTNSPTLEQVLEMVRYALIVADFNHLHPQDTSNLIAKVLSKAPIYRLSMGYQACGMPMYTILELGFNGEVKRPLLSYIVASQVVNTQINNVAVQYNYNILPNQMDMNTFMQFTNPSIAVQRNPGEMNIEAPINPYMNGIQIPELPKIHPAMINNDKTFELLQFIINQLSEQTSILKEISLNTKSVNINSNGRACIDPSKLQPGITPNPINFGQVPLETKESIKIKVTLSDFAKFLERGFKDLNNAMKRSRSEEQFVEIDKIVSLINHQLESYLADHQTTEEYSDLVNAIKEILVSTEIIRTIETLSWDDLCDLIDNLLTGGYNTFPMIFTQALERSSFYKLSFSYKSTSQSDERCIINHKETNQRKVIPFGTAENFILDNPRVDKAMLKTKDIPSELYGQKPEHYYHVPANIMEHLITDVEILNTIKSYKGIPCDLSYECIFDCYRHINGSNPKLDTHEFFENNKYDLAQIGFKVIIDKMLELTSEEESNNEEDISKNTAISSVGLK